MMNDVLLGFGSSESIANAASGLILVAKLTLLLSLAWLGQRLLARHNPRWRVLLWRGVLSGLVLICVFSIAPPLLSWRILPERTAVETRIRETQGVPVDAVAPPDGLRFPDRSMTLDVTPASPSPTTIVASTRLGLPSAAGLLMFFWAIGCLVLGFRLIASAIQISRILRGSKDVPEMIARECHEVAARVGCVRSVRIRSSDLIATPCLAGNRRLTLLIPRAYLLHGEPEDLRAILAHELTHARNNDLFWNLAAHLATVALWFHPLMWRLQSAHAAACESVCDAVAADYLEDARVYIRTLARIALQTLQPPPAHGLAMARTSDVLQRIEALNRGVFRSSLSRGRVALAVLAGAPLIAALGTFAISSAQEAPEDAGPNRVVLRVVDASTGRAAKDVSIKFEYRIDGPFAKKTVISDSEGVAGMDWPPGVILKNLHITAEKPGYVPIRLDLDSARHPIKLPLERLLKLETGTMIQGVVKDESGKPVADASVTLYMRPTESENTGYTRDFANLKTDAQGRWQSDEAPADLERRHVSFGVNHPGYLPGGGPVTRSLGNTVILKRGYTVTGRVLDGAGKPVPNAKVIVGLGNRDSSTPTSKTNEKGDFALDRCKPGPAAVVVEAEGFAPGFQLIEVGTQTSTLQFRLEAGSRLRVKIVDGKGKPIPGAGLYPSVWRGQQMLQTRLEGDKDGRVDWRSAPADIVLYYASKEGFMGRQDIPLTASDREQVVTLLPVLVVSGKVTDSKTGKPIPSFRLIQGQQYAGRDEIYWMRSEAMPFNGGAYTAKFTEGDRNYALRVVAPGYREADSRVFRPADGPQTHDFKLEPSEGITGSVVSADGTPIAGMDVVLATRQNRPYISNGAANNNGNIPHSTTDKAGTFAFPAQDGPFLLMGLCNDGYAEAYSEDFAKASKLTLKPWGRIRGEVMVGSRRGGGQSVTFNHDREDARRSAFIMIGGNEVKADEKGRFIIDHIFPGAGKVSRVVITERGGGMWRHTPGWHEPVEVVGGETARVAVGGKGRPVVGRVVLDAKPDDLFDWQVNTPIQVRQRRGFLGLGPRGWDQFASNIDKNGNFRIEDVPAGNYDLTVNVDGLLATGNRAMHEAIGHGSLAITIPEIPGGQSDEPFDVGVLTAKLFKTLKVGEVAPDFNVPRIKGGTVKFEEFKGKLVLLCFWASWSGPCLVEFPMFEDLQKTYGGDPRFQMVGLSCDNQAKQAEELIRRNKISWTQGFAGNIGQGVPESYGVRALPASFLIGPDGKVLAKNLFGDNLKQTVAQAIKNLK
jgi:beta-lactamase regulating signal transducer with metallopeptidase domain/peroxiredoxin/uncharacterized GH25 family protein